VSPPHDIQSLLDEVVTLPSLPTTIAQIMRLVEDPQASLSAVAKAVSADPSLSFKTLRLVNSAYYGLRQPVATIEHAVMLLGGRVIRNLALTAIVVDLIGRGVGDFFEHSVSCGVAMRALAQALPGGVPVESPEEGFVYGLLHDIGKAVFAQFMAEEHARVADAARSEGIPWHEAERAMIGVDHAELGAALAVKWKLPPELSGAIAGHHEPRRCEQPRARRLAALVAAADFVCHRSGIAPAPDAVVVSETAWREAALPVDAIPGLMDRFFEALPAVGELLRLVS